MLSFCGQVNGLAFCHYLIYLKNLSHLRKTMPEEVHDLMGYFDQTHVNRMDWSKKCIQIL